MKKRVSESKVVMTYGILPKDLNSGGSFYGAKLLEFGDHQSGTCAIRHVRGPVTTAAVDSFEFLKPFQKGDFITVETFVSGVGNESLEIFNKFIGEKPRTGEKYLGAIAFFTFKAKGLNEGEKIPDIIPETEEEAFIMDGYPDRREAVKNKRIRNKKIQEIIRLS
ncbi:MAG: acyl-CoA thioesterase [Tissierellia bacterium]|nr:acyl-CoA thioesterase [Tissierellia bacterium]